MKASRTLYLPGGGTVAIPLDDLRVFSAPAPTLSAPPESDIPWGGIALGGAVGALAAWGIIAWMRR